MDAFFDRFTPESAATSAATGAAVGTSRAAPAESGYYKPTRRNETSVEK